MSFSHIFQKCMVLLRYVVQEMYNRPYGLLIKFVLEAFMLKEKRTELATIFSKTKGVSL